MKGGGVFEYAHTAEVGAYVVERLDNLDGVAAFLGDFEPAFVSIKGIPEAACVTETASEFAAGGYFSVAVAFRGKTVQQDLQGIDVAVCIYKAVAFSSQLLFIYRLYAGPCASGSGNCQDYPQ